MLLAVFLFLFALLPTAQPAETWYFGLRDEQLIAFTASGEIRELEPEFGELMIGWRIDPETAIFIIENPNDVAHLYRLTPQGASEIAVAEQIDLSSMREVLASSDGYIALRDAQNPLPHAGLLINVAPASAELLTGEVARGGWLTDEQLFYVSVADDEAADESIWSLVERSLGSGKERTIYSTTAPENDLLFVTGSSDGNRWVVFARDENRQIINTLVQADGTTEALESGSREAPVIWQFFGNALVGSMPACQTDCSVMVVDDAGELSFDLPGSPVGFAPLARPDQHSLLVNYDSGHIALLSEGDEPRLLGEFDPRVMFSGNRIISTDQRYVFSAWDDDDSSVLFVTDLQSGEPVFSGRTNVGMSILFTDNGFIVSNFEAPQRAFAYYAATDSLEELPAGAGVYFEILPDGSLLYALNRGDESVGEAGIYRYIPADQSYTLLVEEARILYAQPLP